MSRENQRYNGGSRQTAGCIPYRYKNGELELLLVACNNSSKGWVFPKGGWETHEMSKKEGAMRETYEEAGVRGNIGSELGTWSYKGNGSGDHVCTMFALLVTEELDSWPEDQRERAWMSVEDARVACKNWWMREALDQLIERL
ncbi:hypothetical protein SAY86_025583 [Trapa natans]|uniref:Nudix hydrolase domain-containing protein n=1 Tax=Trapa natans TaxID=22666 RepID=A0AAN7M0X8_TRANT|nr:hypothetical protein SAY86_025583 [Trapa natans]